MFRKSDRVLAVAWVVLIACLLIWISGYFFDVFLAYCWHKTDGSVREERISFSNGEIWYLSAFSPINTGVPRGFNGTITRNPAAHFVDPRSFLGFVLPHQDPNSVMVVAGGQVYRLIAAPWWFLSLIPAGLIVWRFRVNRRRRLAMTKNLCVQCGYDLRGTPERCPECGTVPPDLNILHG